ncbi:MAG: hypothetical protein ACJ75G_05105 [Gaiellaceae bacterium]
MRVVVGHRLVHDTAPYAHVFDRFPPAPGPPPHTHWVFLRLRWPVGTPWRYEHAGIDVSPSTRVLAREGGWFRIPAAFAKVVARDART